MFSGGGHIAVALGILAAIVCAVAAFFVLGGRPLLHRRQSATDIPRFVLSFGAQLGDGAEINFDSPGAGPTATVRVVGSGPAKELQFGAQTWLLSDQSSVAAASECVVAHLRGAGWIGDGDLTISATGVLDPHYLDHLDHQIEGLPAAPHFMRNWARRRRTKREH